MTKKLLKIAVAILIASPVVANASFISNEATFVADNAGLTLLDFEGVCSSGYCAVPTYAGVTIAGPAPVIADGPTYGAPSDWLADNTWNGSLDLSFAPTINAVGFKISAGWNGGTAVVNLYDGANLIDTQTITTSAISTFDTFAGFTGLGNISNLHLSVSSGDQFVNIDDLRFGTTAVPEPASLALLGIGLIGIGAMRKKAALTA